MESTFNRADYVTVREVADVEHVTPAAIYLRIHAGKLRAVRVGGRRLLIHRDDAAAQIQPVGTPA